MGVYEGLIGGFLGRKSEIEQQNLAEAGKASDREGKIFSTLLASDDPEIQHLALTGLLDSANPKKRKSGFKGWLGEVQGSPYLPQIQSLINSPKVTQKETLPSTQETSGTALPNVQSSLQEVPPQTGSAAQPATSPVQGGPPPTPTSYTQAPPKPYSISEPRQVFMDPMEKYRQQVVAKAGADVEGDVESWIRMGMSHEQALEQVQAERLRKTTGSASMFNATQGEVPDGKGGWVTAFGVRDLAGGGWRDSNTQQKMPDFRPRMATTGAATTRFFGQDLESISHEPRFGGLPYVQQPSAVQAEINAEKQRRDVLAAGNTTLARGAAENTTKLNAPLTPEVAAQQDVPFGTSMAQLAGTIPLTPANRVRLDAAKSLAPDIDEISSLVDKVFPPESGLLGGMKASEVIASKRISNDPDLAVLQATLARAAGNVAKVLNAESGRLTQQDIERAMATLADLQGFTDTREAAQAKLGTVKSALNRVLSDIRTPTQQLQNRNAPPTPRTLSGFPVTAPDGTIVTFPTQKAADDFRRAYQIQ